MRHFEKDQELLNSSLPASFTSDFGEHLHSVKYHKVSKGLEGNLDLTFLITVRQYLPSQIDWPTNTAQYCTFPPLSNTKFLSNEEISFLHSVYQTMYPRLQITSDSIPHSVTVFKSCFLGSEKL